jgi:hypothetical protein
MLCDVLAFRIKVFRRMSCIGGIGELTVVWPEDRPHHGIAAAVDLPPAARVGGQFGGAPDTSAGARFQLGMLAGDLKHDRFDHRACKAVLRAFRAPSG